MREPDQGRLDQLLGTLVADYGACVSGVLVVLGDRLGLYKAMADGERWTAERLAQATGVPARYLQEWLSAQAAAGYVDYDAAEACFRLTPEQAAVFADEGSPAFFPGAFEVAQAMWTDEPRVAEAFKAGRGFGWHEHCACLFQGVERFFRSGYKAYLVGEWLPALDGMQGRLEKGAVVADVGCGHGASTVLMAEAFPRSRFHGFDYHAPSIDRARAIAKAAGVDDRVTFETASATDYPAERYDLIAMFDCLHDMGDPVGAGRHVREALADDGIWMIVEPFAHDALEDNLNPVGRIYYGASTLLCTPASLAQEVGAALGAQAGEARLRRVAEEAGFTRFRRAAETPFNLVFEARA
ncbi:class I SAM-dependent methyltransferase [Marinivivus vitaminiproducens]|uniref:class I SAM-dependent methyltransferase n=1 Tax=Marinivivus vitaminiproducens TaxID=3035935 RepID=UPI00279CA972|nr:class I SAM-dependent methyltransferase [Geminicoccaceae bacterium SCSIO 64248]